MRLHHVAYVCRDIESKANSLCDLFGFRTASGPVVDKEQAVRIIFLDMGGGPQLELLEPLGPDSPVQEHLKKGGGLYHLCFEVEDLDETLKWVQKDGKAVVVNKSVPAPAMEGRYVAFIVTTDKDLVEFVAADKK